MTWRMGKTGATTKEVRRLKSEVSYDGVEKKSPQQLSFRATFGKEWHRKKCERREVQGRASEAPSECRALSEKAKRRGGERGPDSDP